MNEDLLRMMQLFNEIMENKRRLVKEQIKFEAMKFERERLPFNSNDIQRQMKENEFEKIPKSLICKILKEIARMSYK